MHLAAAGGALGSLRVLLELGGSAGAANCADRAGVIPLHLSARLESADCLAALLAGGARTDAVSQARRCRAAGLPPFPPSLCFLLHRLLCMWRCLE